MSVVSLAPTADERKGGWGTVNRVPQTRTLIPRKIYFPIFVLRCRTGAGRPSKTPSQAWIFKLTPLFLPTLGSPWEGRVGRVERVGEVGLPWIRPCAAG